MPTTDKPIITEVQPGCFDHIPIRILIDFLQQWELQLVQTPNGLAIAKQRVRNDGYPGSR